MSRFTSCVSVFSYSDISNYQISKQNGFGGMSSLHKNAIAQQKESSAQQANTFAQQKDTFYQQKDTLSQQADTIAEQKESFC